VIGDSWHAGVSQPARPDRDEQGLTGPPARAEIPDPSLDEGAAGELCEPRDVHAARVLDGACGRNWARYAGAGSLGTTRRRGGGRGRQRGAIVGKPRERAASTIRSS
jgi:hypothetical protein